MKMFSSFKDKFILVVFFLIYDADSAFSQDATNTTIVISLNKPVTYNNTEIYGDFFELNNTDINVQFTDIPTDLAFIVFQVHSQYYSVILNQISGPNNTNISGSNMGLVSLIKKPPGDKTIDQYLIQNPNVNVTFTIYVSVHGYHTEAPIPGGCNQEFRTPIAPYLSVTTYQDYITVDAAAPSTDLYGYCLSNFANTTFYMMYLTEMSYDADEYFAGIKLMMTLPNILQYGTKVPLSSEYKAMRRFVSAYPGTGAIYVAVAQHVSLANVYSVYVPNHSYGCPESDENGCIFQDDMITDLLCAILLFLGIFVSFLGHRFFKTEMFLAGLLVGFIITYILVSMMGESAIADSPALLSASILAGLFFGAIWFLFWWLYAIPLVAVLLPTLEVGFLLASILYNELPVAYYLQDDFNFWSLFIMTILLVALAMVTVTYSANILCCSILGGFATAYALDYFMGSAVRYIMVNTIRRAVVPMFNYVVLTPPSQWRDITVTIVWVLVSACGWTFQHWHNSGRPPFPPPPRSLRPAPEATSNYGALSQNNETRYVRRVIVRTYGHNERTRLISP